MVMVCNDGGQTGPADGDGHNVGVAGTSSYCGAACKRTTFDVTSPVTQTIYVTTYVHK